MNKVKTQATYYYDTCKIERNFKFVRFNEKCRLSGLPCYVGTTRRCEGCPHNGGSVSSFDIRDVDHRYVGDNEQYVRCLHPDAKDSEGSGNFISMWYEHFRNEAITHYYD